MALLELSLAVARVVFVYDFRKADGKLGSVGQGGPGKGTLRDMTDEFQLWANVTSYCKGPWLAFRRRGMTGEDCRNHA